MEERYCRLQGYLDHKIKETIANESKHQDITVSCTTQGSYCSWKDTRMSHVLLATAKVTVKDRLDKLYVCRAFLDSCYQSNFITENMVKHLQLEQKRNQVHIKGINNAVSAITHSNNIEFISMQTFHKGKLTSIDLPQVTSQMPVWQFPADVKLTDKFHSPSDIYLVIGAGVLFELIEVEKYQYEGFPHLHNTKLGYILSGGIHSSYINQAIHISLRQINCKTN
ncbi:hypothetical protein PR048_017656 [Dryococelus australis]|uniref:Peptidase aspartic putative domain-containing protein n=1 Tax=Dryococelus australis TaxID=614101 RepID=A0ABQ9HAQ3_9NEOP|nr:hypothetical protein PR048_017656 [Dryococelus australis]